MEQLQEIVIEKEVGKPSEEIVTDVSKPFEDSNSFRTLKRMLNPIEWKNERQTETHTICRVLKLTRDDNPGSYDPRIVSVGPYHRGKREFAEMEKLKGYYMERFLRDNREKQLEDYIAVVRGLEGRARGVYVGELNMSSDEFVAMMVLDGCFVVELLLRHEEGVVSWANPRNFIHDLAAFKDLFFLENQVPFFVLQALFNLNQPREPSDRLRELTLGAIIHCADLISCNHSEHISSNEFHHIHHLLHFVYLLATRQQLQANRDIIKVNNPLTRFLKPAIYKLRGMMYKIQQSKFMKKVEKLFGKIESSDRSMACATKLKDAGVTFKRKQNGKNIFDITFENGVLEIPKVTFFDETALMLLNLLAFEQSFMAEENYIASYVWFMDNLINTSDDAEVLEENDIIHNMQGNHEEIALFFNTSCKHIWLPAGSSCLSGVQRDVAAYTNKRRNRWRAKFIADYFSNPWALLSLLAAIFLLLLTVAQTVFAILPYT